MQYKTNKPKLIVILGPTASGKTKLAVKLAANFNGEIISADSRQVFRGMDVGTGKDLKEYEIFKHTPAVSPPREGGEQSGKIPYHLIDVVSPKIKFSLAKYQKMAYKAIDDVIKRGKTPFLVGGTGLYIQAITSGIPLLQAKPDWELRKKLEGWSKEKLLKKLKKMDRNLNDKMLQGNKRRMIRYIEIMEQCKKSISALWKAQKREEKYNCLMIGIGCLRESVNTKIDQRVDRRLNKEKMVEEIELLHKQGVSWKRLESFGLEYKFIAQYLQGKLEYDEMVKLLKIETHQFAKRQMTWFKRDKRIKWVSKYGEAKKMIQKFLK
ncbi:tRNA (adenosine(37)-N6)-dimethylallyltransferase MiaA [Patescibacteria group bacterium]